MPVLKCKKAIDHGAKELLVIGTSQVSKENVIKLAKKEGFKVTLTVDARDEWEMNLLK